MPNKKRPLKKRKGSRTERGSKIPLKELLKKGAILRAMPKSPKFGHPAIPVYHGGSILMCGGHGPLLQPTGLPAPTVTMDAIIKTKLEGMIRDILDNGGYLKIADLLAKVRKRVTKKERACMGGGEDDDVDAATELALRNLENAEHVESMVLDSYELDGEIIELDPSDWEHLWRLTDKGKEHKAKYG